MSTTLLRRIALTASITVITGCATTQLQGAGDAALARGDYAQALADYKNGLVLARDRQEKKELEKKQAEAGKRLAAADAPKARAYLDAGDPEKAIRAAQPLRELAAPDVKADLDDILAKAAMRLWPQVEEDLRDPKKRPDALVRGLELAFFSPEVNQRLAAVNAEIARGHAEKAAAATSPVAKYAHQRLAHYLDPSLAEPANLFASETVAYNVVARGDPCEGFRDQLPTPRNGLSASPVPSRHVVTFTITVSTCALVDKTSTTKTEEEYVEYETQMVDKPEEVCTSTDRVEMKCSKDALGNDTGNCKPQNVTVKDCKTVTRRVEESVPVKRKRTVSNTSSAVELEIAGSFSYEFGGKTETQSFGKSSPRYTPDAKGGVPSSARTDLQEAIKADLKGRVASVLERTEASVRKSLGEQAEEAERRGDAERALFLRIAATRLGGPVDEPVTTWYSREISQDASLLSCSLGLSCPSMSPGLEVNAYPLVLPAPNKSAGDNDAMLDQIEDRRKWGGETGVELGVTYLNVPSFGEKAPAPLPSGAPSLGLLGGYRGEVHFIGGREVGVIGIPLDLRIGFDIKGNFHLDSAFSGLFGVRLFGANLMLAGLAGSGVDMIAGASDDIYCVPIGLFAQLGGVAAIRFPGAWELDLRGSYVFRTGDRVDTEKRAEARLLRFIAGGNASLALAIRFTRYEGDILPRDGLRALLGLRL